MTVDEIIKEVRAGNVLAPVGTKTFAVLVITADNKLDAAGTIATEHADELAYWIMAQKRIPNMPSDASRADKEAPEVEVVE